MTNLFAWRYFRSKKSTNAINIIAWISMVAITLVTAALVVVLSVFNGFEAMVNSLYGDFYSDLTITPSSGKYLSFTPALRDSLHGHLGENKAIMPVIQERAVLVDEEDKSIVWLKGVTDEFETHGGIARNIYRGKYAIGTTDEPALVLGAGIENALQIQSGMAVFPVTVYLPNKNADGNDPLSALFSANAFPAGTFSIQQEFDDQYAITNAGFVQNMLGLGPDRFTAIEIYAGKNEMIPERSAKALSSFLGPRYEVKTRVRQNQNLYAAMATERLIIYAVAILVLLIAAFNIISSLSIMVLEKRTDIAMLQAIGTTSAAIGSIYLKLGAILAGLGGIAGLMIGAAICMAQQQFHLVKIAGESFLIDYYPVTMKSSDFLLIFLLIAIVAFIAGFVPATKATRIHHSLRSAEE